jgi:hypothetical protein
VRLAHGRLCELIGIHLTQPLVALDRILVLLARLLQPGEHRLELLSGVRVDRLVRLRAGVHDDDPMQGRHGGVDATVDDHLGHVLVEQREQQGADVRAVDIGVAHDDDLAVPRLLEVERAPRARADHLDDRRAFGVREHVGDGRLLHVEDLAADRQQRLELAVARQLGGAERGVALNDEQLGAEHVVRPAVHELGGQR